MASRLLQGESLFIPFRDGVSISDSQLKPRMYKTQEAFKKSFPEYYLGKDGVELIEYAPVVHGRWKNGVCPVCGFDIRCLTGENDLEQWVWDEGFNYCPQCGAKMDLED